MSPYRLPPEALIRRCDLSELPPHTPQGPFFGQERGLAALEFGLMMPGYHIFLEGPPHTGRLTAARQCAEQAAQHWPTPNDWYYVIRDKQHLRAEHAPPGEGDVAGGGVMVTHSSRKAQGAPVILADQPTRRDLLGGIRWHLREGSLHVELHDIQPGLLHQANGGVLIARVEDLLSAPGTWEGLLQALVSQRIELETDSPPTWPALAPRPTADPIPLDLTVILIGDAYDYEWLLHRDPNFTRAFRVKAAFSDTMRRTPDNEALYVGFCHRLCQHERLLRLEDEALAGLVEYGSWLAEDQRKLSTQLTWIADCVREANFYARRLKHQTITRADVVMALEAYTARHNHDEQDALQRIADGQVYIDTSGAAVGQVNALVVIDAADYTYALPSRLTARVYLGREGIVQLDHESQMTGPIHDKGMLTLIGYLGGHYAHDYPLSLSASLAFEQNYADIDGDSASCAELFALLSAIGDFPLRQDIAVTGSINQMGRVQPIGDVTRKIEGFFKVCQLNGLTGPQGVIIPRANAPELMLTPDVIEAVNAGQFHIYAIETADEGIALLADRKPQAVHLAVDGRLRDLALRIETYSSKDDDEDAQDDQNDQA